MSELQRADVVQVSVSAEEEVPASYADLNVVVKGSSLVSANAALAKAREVASLVVALKAVGVEEADVRVRQITAEVTNGLLTKTSSATYSLEVRCRKLDALPEILGAITSQKNVTLGSIDWGFEDEHAVRTRLLAACAHKANERARQVAQVLGVQIVGVHRFTELVAGARGDAYEGAPGAYGGSLGAPKMRMGAADLGLGITHTKTVEVRALAEYRVGGFVAEKA